jgi:hypothetical protein
MLTPYGSPGVTKYDGVFEKPGALYMDIPAPGRSRFIKF